MTESTTVTIDVGGESFGRAAKRLRQALEECISGGLRLGDYSEHGLLGELINDMRIDEGKVVYRGEQA